jgi:hypothetical protein
MRPSRFAPVALLVAGLACSRPASGPDRAAPGSPEEGASAISVAPGHVELAPSEQAALSATVQGASASVVWSVQEADGGAVSAAGLYTAPGRAGVFHVVATSTSDPTVSGSAVITVVAPTPPPTSDLLPTSRTTTWSPGIPGGVPSRTTVCATISAATYGNGSTDATKAIQGAIDACPQDQVVVLPAGTYRLSDAIYLNRRVVLRGAGAKATTLAASGSVAVMIGSWTSFGTPLSLTADAAKGSTSLTVSDASGVAVGDILHLDQLDDPAVVQGEECPYLKRGSSGAWRSIGQMVEVAGKSGNTLTLTSPLHWTFTRALQAQLVPLSPQPTRYAGLENLHITGAGTVGVNVQYAAYSWMKGVETDHVDGVHVSLTGTYRFVLRDSYAHHSVTYSYGGVSYGYSLEWQASDNLVENNIVTYMNKPIQFRAAGGGNVVAYNYVDDAWSQPDSGGNFWFQEVSIDVHCSFPFMNLIEGNYAPHMGGASTWGNAGYLTYFRNQSTSVYRTIALSGPNAPANQTAVELDARMIGMNVVGNVLGSPDLSGARYETTGPSDCTTPAPFVFRLNYDGATGYCAFPSPVDTQASDTLLRHGNYDYATRSLQWSPSISSQTLPASLYLTSKPAFFGSSPWPWVDPTGPTISTLPAKARFDAGTPNG